MDGAGIGSALGLLVLEFIELREDFHGDPDVVFLETLEGEGIVEEDVGIEDEVLDGCGGDCAGAAGETGLGGGDEAGILEDWFVTVAVTIAVAGIVEWVELVHEIRRVFGTTVERFEGRPIERICAWMSHALSPRMVECFHLATRCSGFCGKIQ